MGNQQSTHYGQRRHVGPVALTPSMIQAPGQFAVKPTMIQGPNVKYGAPGPSVGSIVINEPNSMSDVQQVSGARLVWDPDRHGYWVHDNIPGPSVEGRPPYVAAIHEITPYGARLVDSIPEPEDEIIKVVKRKKKVESSDSESDDEPVMYVPVVVPTGPTEFYPAPRPMPFNFETQSRNRGGCRAYTSCNGCVM